MSSLEIVRAEGLSAVRVIVPRRHQDGRGFFSEVWREDDLHDAGIIARFVQENQSFSHERGTIRGMHFQIGESAQAKLIRCTRGSIFDVVVDIRHGSPNFGRHAAFVLSAENWKQLYVPIGFAHGYCTLDASTEVIYKVTAYYDRDREGGIVWDDPQIGIEWPATPDTATVNERDRQFPPLAQLPKLFPFARYPD